MAAGDDIREGMLPENLKTQLAIAVRSIRWSYAIFWSISPSSNNEGVLEWREGYYNGDIKTRKTVQAVDFNTDHMGLLRSEQLKELFQSLSANETNPQTKRPTAALSPEDLTDTEWYYLVCMSFVFNIGQELPGSTFANGQPIWLCNAHSADSKIFGRSLLAKSASIQTVVCFPYLGGVIELGVTEMVQEDSSLIEHVKTAFLNNYPSRNVGRNEDMMMIVDSDGFPSDCCDLAMDRSFIVEEEISNCMHNVTSSSECISHGLKNTNDFSCYSINEIDELDLIETRQDNHYKGVVASLLNSSRRFRKLKNQESSFVGWNKLLQPDHIPRTGVSQRVLKKILMDVPQMSSKKNNENNSSHTLSERRRRERINERFSVLESLIPSTSKVDKVSILDNTIGYLKELEKRVEGLESRTKRKHSETSENTSDNYENNKRKLGAITETTFENCSSDKVKVTVEEEKKDVVIEIRCVWRESLFVEIMDAMGRLHLDSRSVQSSNTDGLLSMTIISKFKGSMAGSAGMVTEVLQRVVWKR
ncbi:transcription factor EGL1 [Impatiens glandulifera]|uniref:transcription factor EGL1 n=1 Tax=Impatiens glandulifera TaxID=253017 RepID=UPI001FB07BCA|nr:transcription factor EGL1 [Impatiens glandulifera]